MPSHLQADAAVLAGLAEQASANDGRFAAFVTIGVDGYGPVNEAFGLAAAEMLLDRVAEALLDLPTAIQVCGYIGVDTFGLLLAERWADEHSARAACVRVAEEVGFALRAMLPLDGGIEIRVVTSCGYVVLSPDCDMSSEEMVTSAEIARKQAAFEGVAPRLREFQPHMVQEIQERVSLISGLRKGLWSGELALYAQPVVNCDRELVSCEALLRWMSPERGVMLPDEFIGLAEQTGLIVEIGEWVLEEACRVLASWSASEDMRDMHMSINVSAKQLEHDGFVGAVLGALDRHGVNPDRLLLEMTEGALHHDTDRLVAMLEALRAGGVRTSLDDFGTGYSSLSYLQRLPIDQVKIDRSFVHGLHAGAIDAAIITMIVDLSRVLGLQVVAEGVETEAQFAALTALGIDRYQGWLFGKAVPVHDLANFRG